jgi:uncharacterized membrane protein YccC
MSTTTPPSSLDLARLLRELQPVPEHAVRAAQELPATRAEIDQLLARAADDDALREELEGDLEAALRALGLDPSESDLRELRRRLDP